jgi:hypothetical protein
VVAGIGEVDVAERINSHALRRVQLRLRRQTAVAVEPAHARTSDGGDEPVRADLPDPVVETVGDIEVALAVEDGGAGPVQSSL